MQDAPLKYQGYSIVFQEVPDEISLAISVSGCPYRCEGCHSPNLQEYEGEYLLQDFEKILDEYEGKITCVCFMGGDQNLIELIELCDMAHERDLKTCLYTGSVGCAYLQPLQPHLDYLKIGPYVKECGGLDNENTNQVMFRMVDGIPVEDITYKFQKQYRFRTMGD